MEEKILQIFREILKLSTYDHDTDAYYLNKMDYEILGLSNPKIRKNIIKIFDRLNINLQYPHKLLPEIQDEYLFKEYNDIQLRLKDNLSFDEFKQLDNRRIILRNKIVSDNLELIKVIINRRMFDVHDNIDKEDVYQFGYEKLINYIDSSYLDKDKMRVEIGSELILYIENQILHTKNNIGSVRNGQVSRLRDIIDDAPYLTQYELSEKLDLRESQIRVLTNLDNLLLLISIDELVDEDIKEDTDDLLLFLDDRFEDKMIEELEIRECINLIVSTLPKDKQDILNLYFGLNGYSRYNTVQIGEMYNLTRAGVSSIITSTLEIIRKSLRMRYLMERLDNIYEIDNFDELEQLDKLNIDLEDKLIRNMPVNIINKLREYLNDEQGRFLLLYCEDDRCSIKEIAEEMNISIVYAYRIKNKIIKMMRIILLDVVNENVCVYDDYYYQYIKYLMNIYSYQIKVKKRG